MILKWGCKDEDVKDEDIKDEKMCIIYEDKINVVIIKNYIITLTRTSTNACLSWHQLSYILYYYIYLLVSKQCANKYAYLYFLEGSTQIKLFIS